MTQFFHFQIIVVTFLLFLATRGLRKKTEEEEEEDYSIVATIATLLFISTFTLMPYVNYQFALTNIEVFNSGKSLNCNSSNHNFANQEFLLDNKHWYLKEYQFISKENGLIVKAHMCEER